MTSPVSKKALLNELIGRKKREKEFKQFKLEDHLFDEQLKFVLDPSPNKVAVCSRRAGKTTACAADLVHTAINNPSTASLYITLSRSNAKKLIWKEIRNLNRTYKLGGVEHRSDLSITFPNEATIYLSGAHDSSEIDKFRGLALKLVYIDEVQSFRAYIEDLINNSLAPTLMDYAGTLNIIGTPGPIPKGFFHDAYALKSTWSKHHWTFFNNPFITQTSKLTHKEMLDRELKRRGVSIDDPSVQREFFGRFVVDSDSLLLHYNDKVNDYKDVPELRSKWYYILGIDLGFEDADALAVLAWNEADPTTYLVEEKVVKQQGLTELVEQIQALQKKYDISKMVIDQGGLGKKLAEEMRRRHNIPVEAADKTRKMENIAFLNDALRTGKLKAKTNSKFAQDTFLVEIDKDKSTPDRIKVSDKYHSDIIDAVLYAFKESPAYSYIKPKPIPVTGTSEWAKQEEVNMWENAVAHHQQEIELIRRLNNGGFE
jgi:phage terminase large subunit